MGEIKANTLSAILFGQGQLEQMQLIALCLPPWDIIKDYRR